MRYGIFSDIHGNLEALERVISQLKREGVDRYVCLGDIVGYGANPNECIHLVKDLRPKIVAGNHDWGVAGLTDIGNFNDIAAISVEWTQSVISFTNLVFLRELKVMCDVEEEGRYFHISHSTMSSPHLMMTYHVKSK